MDKIGGGCRTNQNTAPTSDQYEADHGDREQFMDATENDLIPLDGGSSDIIPPDDILSIPPPPGLLRKGAPTFIPQQMGKDIQDGLGQLPSSEEQEQEDQASRRGCSPSASRRGRSHSPIFGVLGGWGRDGQPRVVHPGPRR